MSLPCNAQSKHAFFCLALVIGAGLVFTAGVIVGHGMCKDNKTIAVNATNNSNHKPSGILQPQKQTPSVEKVKSPSTSVHRDYPSPSARYYSLQVASFYKQTQAEHLVNHLESCGYLHVHYVKATVPSKGIFYRVYVGKFITHKDARKVQHALKTHEKLKALIVEAQH